MIDNGNQATGRPLTDETSDGARSWLHRLFEPAVLSTGVTLVILAVIWVTTLNLAASEKAAARRSAAALTADLADTYEAQVVRALREIDTTLKLVRYSLAGGSARNVLENLRSRGLLPPELLFSVTVTDADGFVVATTDPPTIESVVGFDFFERAREDDAMLVGVPGYDHQVDEWRLYFSRRIEAPGGGFAGIVAVSVHAAYFVSGYEPGELGERGVLGLVGTDGIFLVRRTGDEVAGGEQIDYGALVPDDDAGGAVPALRVNGWDDVRRYTIARKLFEFPLAIVVGLSEAEQLAAAERLERTYMWRAAVASAVVVVIAALLGRMSWQLQKARAQVVEEQVEHARQVEYLAYHDNLTDLPNRAFFNQLLVQAIQQAGRYDRKLALLFLDLDRFKTINDSLGHEAGDELLREVARRLNQSVRDSDIVARLGGDEFVVLLPELTAESHLWRVADKILAAVSRPYTLAGQEFRVTASIGVSVFPRDGTDEETLMKNADIAMYHAKEEGKNNYQYYSEELNADSLERIALESSLRNALGNGEFRLFYQARRDMSSARVTGMEALLRWQHPDLGLLAPMQFLPLAEETGLIIPIGRWVLETACRQNVSWQEQGFPALSIAINVSARQFLDEDLVRDVDNALRGTGMAPHLLELEIAEGVIMRDVEKTVRVLGKLKKLGVRLVMDNFGTGYSSLSTLKQFAFDTIKIDGSFIRDVHDSQRNQSLTEAVIAVSRSLSLTVVAQGVESADQAEFLRTHACDEVQGFYINKPVPAEDFASLIGGPDRGSKLTGQGA